MLCFPLRFSFTARAPHCLTVAMPVFACWDSFLSLWRKSASDVFRLVDKYVDCCLQLAEFLIFYDQTSPLSLSLSLSPCVFISLSFAFKAPLCLNHNYLIYLDIFFIPCSSLSSNIWRNRWENNGGLRGRTFPNPDLHSLLSLSCVHQFPPSTGTKNRWRSSLHSFFESRKIAAPGWQKKDECVGV